MAFAAGFAPAAEAATSPTPINTYNVVWDSPSQDHLGSMPLGNGDIGLNAWMEPNGDLCFYISKTDSWGDNGRLLKVGKVRISLSPNPLTSEAKFKQTLNIQTGKMIIDIEGDNPTQVKLWVDANNPLVVCETESQKPVKATAKIELWRTERTALPKVEIGDHRARFPKKMAEEQDMTTYVEPDTLLKGLKNGIGWYHRNEKSDGPAMSMEFQGLKEFTQRADYKDPLLHRIFGAVIKSEGGKVVDDETLVSKAAKKQRVTIAVNTLHPGTPDAWLDSIDDIFVKAANTEQNDQAHKQWWANFWQRSHLSITQNAISQFKGAKEEDAYIVSLGYNLQRFIDACAGRGSYPIKFNGSLFTVPAEGEPGDADYRRWGACYWWQNTRLPYLSMCNSGDFDLMKPFFRYYIDNIFPVSEYRTKKYFGIEGAYFLEMNSMYGTSPMGIYGWDKPMKDRKDPLQINRFHKWEWVAGPELVFMMLEYYAYTGDEE
ncbi:MAG: DUF5703 domain-containing protein, partial [Kiritimatiellaceae bacterium]|nr:DUF5703 domain-containing protein [Kiritimatiellaceae bacterium]